MKKTILFVCACLAAISSYSQVLNGGFENWTTVGNYEIPNNWGTMNHTTATYSVYTATKATPGSPGNSYMKLTSKSAGGSVVNGIAVSGKLDTVTLKPVSGFPFTQRPASFNGKWQHMIYGNSQGSVRVLTTRWNATSGKRDTVAHAEQTLSGMAMSWANFAMNLTYLDSLNYPDSCIITLQASGSNPTNNDYLWVDNLAFSGTVAVVVLPPPHPVGLSGLENELTTHDVFPNPAKEFIMVALSVPAPQTLNLAIYDLSGKMVKHQLISVAAGKVTEKIDTRDLSRGTYLLSITGEKVNATKSLVIE